MQEHRPEPEKIKSMFAKVAANYDRANSILSVGIHHLWRRKLVRLSGLKPGQSVLDCATGTGDLAIAMSKAVGPTGKVIGTDFCEEMLESAPKKAKERGQQIQFETADVTKLPYADASFDLTSISFGIRNVGNPLQGLKEMARVTKPGGTVMVLEFSQVDWPVLAPLYNFYSEKVLPKIGGLVTGQGAAYEYLQTSSKLFPAREKFTALMEQTGTLENAEYFPLTGGIACIYRARKKS